LNVKRNTYHLIAGFICLGFISNSCLRNQNESSSAQKVATKTENYRLTPVEISNRLYQAVEYRWTFPDGLGSTIDIVKDFFGPALGGLDFESAHVRDHSAKVQTILTARLITWNIMLQVIFREAVPANALIFTLSDPNVDRPFLIPEDLAQPPATQTAIRAGEDRWELQLKNFYWRFYSRAITDEELIAVRISFSDIVRNDPAGVLGGWLFTMYAMSSTEEFWNK